LSALEGAVASLTRRAEAAEARADVADADRRSERERADKAEAALGAERGRADLLRDKIDALTGELRRSEDGALALRQADTARRARGLLARLGAAFRGE
jgi:hypothetical protein